MTGNCMTHPPLELPWILQESRIIAWKTTGPHQSCSGRVSSDFTSRQTANFPAPGSTPPSLSQGKAVPETASSSSHPGNPQCLETQRPILSPDGQHFSSHRPFSAKLCFALSAMLCRQTKRLSPVITLEIPDMPGPSTGQDKYWMPSCRWKDNHCRQIRGMSEWLTIPVA